MIVRNEQDFFSIKELSEKTNLKYKSVHVKLTRRKIKADFAVGRTLYYHYSAVDILKGKHLNHKMVYEKIYITNTYHIYESKMNYLTEL